MPGAPPPPLRWPSRQTAGDGLTPYVGIVGGGQLGRMLGLAAAPLGIETGVIDPSPQAGAQIVADHMVAPFDDLDALRKLAGRSDVVTFEFENVSAAALEAIASKATVAPPIRALEVSQDRLSEKRLFATLGIPTAPYRTVDSLAELATAIDELGGPAILKTRRFGYDGKGQARVEPGGDLAHAWSSVGEVPSVLEGLVDFDRELSIIAVRSSSGEIATYPLAENVHRTGILRTSTAPATVDPTASALASEYATSLLGELDYVGVLALELFDVGGELIANEFAPRVHNSGHWTSDAAPTSQFENHIRAVLGLPLGATAPVQECMMFNLIGGAPPTEALMAIPGAHVHLYAKEPRAGRKLGHVTVTRVADADFTVAVDAVRVLVDAATV